MKSNTSISLLEHSGAWFIGISQLFWGLAILDRDLRLVHVNERMTDITGRSFDQFAGKTLHEVDPEIAAVTEPMVRHAIESGAPLVEVETSITKSSEHQPVETAYWCISCYPIKADDGTVQGAGLLVRDVSAERQKDAVQNERLEFEAILSDLSAAFINVPVCDVDTKIEQGLKKMVEFLEFDRCTIWQYLPDNRMHSTHSYSLPGIKLPPPFLEDPSPEWWKIQRNGEAFQVSSVDQLPDTFWREKKYCKEQGDIKSFLFIPLNVGGTVVGLLSFASYQVNRKWPNQLIQRLKLLWEVFGNALERKRADQKIQNALAEIEALKDRLEAENFYLRDQIKIENKYEEIIGQSESIRKVLQQVEQVAHTDSTVLILGETGTGKELMARAIHNLSARRERAMITLNCAALPPTLIEAELFGREKGAYTGAVTTQMGRFEAAHGSTIFLDEIGEMPLELQAKLLRVLQQGQFERLGSTKSINVNVRLIAATNRDLVKAVQKGRFREDLYYRLNVFPLRVPPLRDRLEDIPALVWAMVKEFGKLFGKTIERIPRKDMAALENYHWPGNIRELRNVVERGMILSNGATLVVDLPENAASATSSLLSFEENERQHLLRVIGLTGWRVRGKDGAAEKLKINANTLESKMKKLGIVRKNYPSNF